MVASWDKDVNSEKRGEERRPSLQGGSSDPRIQRQREIGCLDRGSRE